MKKYVVLYESSDDVLSRAQANFAAHQARWKEFQERGELLGVGPFADPQRDGSMGIFRSREGAEEFVRDDPFVTNGVVRSYRILEWNDALSD